MNINKKTNYTKNDEPETTNKYQINLKYQFKTEKILMLTKTLKQEINIFNKLLFKIENAFDNPNDIVYDECLELKRLIQLNMEQNISKICNLKENNSIFSFIDTIDNIKNNSTELILKINIYENNLNQLWYNNKPNKKLFISNINYIKLFSTVFTIHWFKKVETLEFEDNELNKAVIKLHFFQDELAKLLKKINFYFFNNNVIKIRNIYDKNSHHISNAYLYYKQQITFDNTNDFDLKEIIKSSSFQLFKENLKELRMISFNILMNGSYLVFFNCYFYYNILTKYTYITIYDPILRKIKIENLFESKYKSYRDVYVNKDLFAIEFYNNNGKLNLSLMKNDLKEIKQIESGLVRGFNDSFIFTSSIKYKLGCNNILVIFNWNLEKIKTIEFNDNPAALFHIHFKYLYSFNFRSIGNYYIFSNDKIIVIFNNNGIVHKNIKLNQMQCTLSGQQISNNEDIILIDLKNNKLHYLNINRVKVKQLMIKNILLNKNFGYNYVIKFDPNHKLVVLNNITSMLNL